MENLSVKSRLNARKIAITGVLSAFSILLTMVPQLGYIPIGPVQITTMHIPVIIGAVLEGPFVGAIIGLIFGLSSLYTAATIFASMPTAFVFLNPLVSVLPRILIGIAAYYAYSGIKKLFKKKSIAVVFGSIAGTVTNTVGVLGMIYILYAKPYAEAIIKSSPEPIAVKSLAGIIFGGLALNFVVEIIMAALICTPVVLSITRLKRQ